MAGSQKSYVMNGLALVAHNQGYVMSSEGEECACNCCDRWYIFRRDKSTDSHWINSLPLNELGFETGQGPGPNTCTHLTNYCYNELYPAYIAICCNSFIPNQSQLEIPVFGGGMYYYGANDFQHDNSPDVRFFENFVYGGDGPDGRRNGRCGMSNLKAHLPDPMDPQGEVEFDYPTFYHVPWYFQVNFSRSTWPTYNNWPRAIYKGFLAGGMTMTTEEIVSHNISDQGRYFAIEFVHREKSTGIWNCEGTNCSNFHIYKREFSPDTVYSGAYLEQETHWGCRPILCTGDRQDVTWDIPGQHWNPTTFVYPLSIADLPCSFGCSDLVQGGGGQGEPSDPYEFFTPHEISTSLGAFGGVSPSRASLSHIRYNYDTGEFYVPPGLHPDETDDPIWWPGQGGVASRIFDSLHDDMMYDSRSPLYWPLDSYEHGACPYKPVSTVADYYNVWHSTVPDYSDPEFLDPENPNGPWYEGEHHHYAYYNRDTVGSWPHEVERACGSIRTNCVRESNPVSEGIYDLDPVPFIPFAGLRMFVDLIPQNDNTLSPFSVYLNHLHNPKKKDEFIEQYSERIVFDTSGNQYLVSLPYQVDLSTDGLPHYPQIDRGFPKLRKEQFEQIEIDQISEITVEFSIKCSSTIQNEFCELSLNAVVFPSEGINNTTKQLSLNDGMEFEVGAHRHLDEILITVEVPYGVSKKTFEKSIKINCIKDLDCAFTESSSEERSNIQIIVDSVTFQV